MIFDKLLSYVCVFIVHLFDTVLQTIHLFKHLFLQLFYQVSVWPQAGRSRAISIKKTRTNSFKDLYQVSVWPQAGRSQAISSQNSKNNYFKAVSVFKTEM